MHVNFVGHEKTILYLLYARFYGKDLETYISVKR